MNCMIMSRISYDEKERSVTELLQEERAIKEDRKWGRKSYGLKEWCS